MNKIKNILKTLTVLYAEDDQTTRENISKTLSLFVKRGSNSFRWFTSDKTI